MPKKSKSSVGKKGRSKLLGREGNPLNAQIGADDTALRLKKQVMSHEAREPNPPTFVQPANVDQSSKATAALKKTVGKLEAMLIEQEKKDLLLRSSLPEEMPPNPFCAQDPDYPLDRDSARLDLSEFSVADNWVEDALHFQLVKQLTRDGIQYFARSNSLHNKTTINQEWDFWLEQARKPYEVGKHAVGMQDTRRPAHVAYLDRGPPRDRSEHDAIKDGIHNRRTWYIGISLNRNRSGLAFVNWIKKEFVPFVVSASRLMANIDMSGAAQFSPDDIKIIEKYMKVEDRPAGMDMWLVDKNTAAQAAVQAKKNQQHSAHDVRARLLALACFRYHQAGYDWIAYENDRKRIGSNEPKMTESNWRQRLKLADRILREEWKGLFDSPPEKMPGIMWRPIVRSKTKRHLL